MLNTRFDSALVWFRRDLRNFDHAALHHALATSKRVYCAFIFDRAILNALPRHDRRVRFIHASVAELAHSLEASGGGLIVQHADAEKAIPRLAAQLGVDAVFANRDYEPQAHTRDAAVAAALQADGRQWHAFKDQVIFDTDEVMTQAGTPFSVFTPYKNAWMKQLHLHEESSLRPLAAAPKPAQLMPVPTALSGLPSLAELGFQDGAPPLSAGMSGGEKLFGAFSDKLTAYHQQRDFPERDGTSKLSTHLRFGTVSIRGLARHALTAMRMDGGDGAATWLSELIWRDFYFMILHHHPRVIRQAFKPAYDNIIWESGAEADALFAAWCEGRTGYPLVDAAMHELNQTGFMHNRLRMVSASFLVKDLGIDWRRGERYFAAQLNDYDLAANNGGWQWAASTGCDAQPYFRIFNPVTQSKKFDPDGRFIAQYLPILQRLPAKYIHAPWQAPGAALEQAGILLGTDYPFPIIDHDAARKTTLTRFLAVQDVQKAQ